MAPQIAFKFYKKLGHFMNQSLKDFLMKRPRFLLYLARRKFLLPVMWETQQLTLIQKPH